MRVADNWKDYELIDCSCGERLERWGNITLIRPDPQVIWKTEKKNPLWKKADAIYHRSQTGGGQWEIRNKIPDFWTIGYRDLTFNIKRMGFITARSHNFQHIPLMGKRDCMASHLFS